MQGRKGVGSVGLSVTHPGRRTPAPVFGELDTVRLARDLKSAAGVIPKGTVATVLQVFEGGRAYQVEFEGPYQAPETVLATDLEAQRARPA
jgi:hypothetical protein